ncbi:hypothetical protein WDU94_000687 [Cyamophila willieti]
MRKTLWKVSSVLGSVNYFTILLLLCQVAILLMSSCTIYKKKLLNRFAIGIGLYETRVRIHYCDLTLCTTVLALHLVSHLISRVHYLASLPYPIFLARGVYYRYAPFLLQCFNILKNDSHLQHVIYFKLTTLLYVLFGCVQCFVAGNVLLSVVQHWKPILFKENTKAVATT